LLRESQRPELVAEIAQHTAETLIRVYAEPNPQIAMIELLDFTGNQIPSFAHLLQVLVRRPCQNRS